MQEMIRRVRTAAASKLKGILARIGRSVYPPPGPEHWQNGASSQPTQVLLRLHYQELGRRALPLQRLSDAEFRCYSQNSEDGILLYLFSLLSPGNRRALEICAGDGIECNSANLIVNHGWLGLLVDGDPANIAKGKQFYRRCRNTVLHPPTFIESWITAENVNELISDSGYAGEIDLLSLDLDGNDFWIWNAITIAKPRVVVLEFNAAFGPEASLTLPYDPNFRLDFSVQPYRCGASLQAFVRLGRKKGYRLVGVQSNGFNAFFLQNGLLDELLPEKTSADCYREIEHLQGWTESSLRNLLQSGQAWEQV